MRASISILRGKIRVKEEVVASEAASVVQTLMTSSHKCLVEVAGVASTLTWGEVALILVVMAEDKEDNEGKEIKANKSNSSSSKGHHQQKKSPNFLRIQTSNN
jgi:hypothetical protein